MRLLTNFPRLCFIMVLLSILGLCIAQENMQLLLVAGALAAISWYVTEGPRGRSLPRWVSNVLVLGITLHVMFDLLQVGSDILESVSRFALWLTLIKLYERRTPRDHAQLMLLSFLLMLIASLQTLELRFGLILMAYAVLGLYVLVLYQLYAAHDQVRNERQASIPEGARITPSTKPIIGRAPAMQFRALVVGLGAAGFVLSIVTFIAFPRGLGATTFGDLTRSMSRSVTGFTDEIDLLHGRRITESRREVLRVQFFDEDGSLRRPPGAVILLRGAVLDQYEGDGRWKLTNRMWHLRHAVDDEFRPLAPRRVSELPEWTMRVDVMGDSETLFTTQRLISIRTDMPRSLKFDPETGVIKTESDAPQLRSYEIKFDTRPREYAGAARPPADAQWLTDLRALRDDRVAELAQKILAGEGLSAEPQPLRQPPDNDGEHDDDRPALSSDFWEWQRAAAQAFERFLRMPPFTYSIDLSHIVRRSRNSESDDPIISFLLEHHRGHCEYFASAMMALCYNLGVESRMVTGYVVAAYDSALEPHKVLERNAHAWVEVRTGPNQWQTFDPTPPQVLNEFHSPDVSSADRLRWIYDRFDMAWNRTFVRYDSQSQTRLAERWELGIGDRAQSAVDRMKLFINDLNRLFRFRPATYLWLGLIAFIIVLGSIVLVQMFRRLLTLRDVLGLRHVRGRQYHRMLRQLGFYLDMLTVLDRAKIAKPQWQPPLQFAEQLALSHPDEATIVRQVTDGFYRARYGRRPLSQEELRELRTGVSTLADRFNVRL